MMLLWLTLDYHYDYFISACQFFQNATCAGGMATTDNDKGEDLIQATLAKKGYTEVSKLGEGGMGVVYKCRHADGGLRVLKFSRGDFESSEEAQALLEEGNQMRQLRHPNLVQIWQLIMTPTLVMLELEFLAGGDLHCRIHDPQGRPISSEILMIRA